MCPPFPEAHGMLTGQSAGLVLLNFSLSPVSNRRRGSNGTKTRAFTCEQGNHTEMGSVLRMLPLWACFPDPQHWHVLIVPGRVTSLQSSFISLLGLLDPEDKAICSPSPDHEYRHRRYSNVTHFISRPKVWANFWTIPSSKSGITISSKRNWISCTWSSLLNWYPYNFR